MVKLDRDAVRAALTECFYLQLVLGKAKNLFLTKLFKYKIMSFEGEDSFHIRKSLV